MSSMHCQNKFDGMSTEGRRNVDGSRDTSYSLQQCRKDEMKGPQIDYLLSIVPLVTENFGTGLQGCRVVSQLLNL